MCFIYFSERFVPARHGAQAPEDGIHKASDTGAGEGIPLQPLPDQEEKNRDRPHSSLVGATDQDLVPEQADEVEERQQATQYQKCPQEDKPGWSHYHKQEYSRQKLNKIKKRGKETNQQQCDNKCKSYCRNELCRS